jgi:flagellar biosynthesis/type III secretory pathway chaperone
VTILDNILNQLQDVIQQELVTYKDILSKVRQKKEALLKNDVDMLDRIVAHEWNIVKTLKQLETERELVIKRIAAAHGLDFKTVTLDDIAGLEEGALHAGLLSLKEELKKVISEIDAVGRVNKGLVDTHLQYSAFCVNLLTGQTSTLGTYSYSGRMSEPQERPTLVLDRMV